MINKSIEEAKKTVKHITHSKSFSQKKLDAKWHTNAQLQGDQ